MKLFNQVCKYGAVALVGMSTIAANAAIDVTAVTTTISDVVTAAAAVGGAALAMAIGIKAYKWLKGAA